MSERIYACEMVLPTIHSFGQLKPAKEADQAMLSDWCEQFCIDARIDDETVYFKAQLPRKIADQSLFVWETDETVSMAAIERETSHGVAISWVYTPLHLRKKGYATSCVAALTQRMLESGKHFCCLYTDLSNPASNSIYQKIGYQPICDVQDWIFE
jgi:predicted GNAT family acetyltransferase